MHNKKPKGSCSFSNPPGGKSIALSAQAAVLPEFTESFCEKEKNLSSQIDF